MKINEITTKDYNDAYKYHRKDYWKRKLNNKFDNELLIGKNSLVKAKKIFKNNVDIVNIETSSYCNRKCGYCPVSVYGRNFKSFIEPNLYKNIIKSLKSINYSHSVCLNLYNEPLSDKNFGFYINHARKNLPLSIIKTNSNGDYIKSLNDLVNLEKLGLNKITITMHTPKDKSYSEIYMKTSLKKFAKRINFILDQNHLNNLGFSFQLNKLFVNVQCINFFEEGTNRGGSVDKTLNLKERFSPCAKPYREFTVYYDGNVTPCCDIFNSRNYDKNRIYEVNSNDENSIFKIYASDKLSAWRKHLFGWNKKEGVCGKCSAPDLAEKEDNILRKKYL